MVQVSYPGVYVVEKASGVRTITGVATSITAFIGRASRGPVNDPIRIQNYSDYDRTFGGLSLDSTMSYAVQQFFQNGGSDALIVRIYAVGAPPPADGIAVLPLASGAVAASGTLTLATNPSDTDTMTIGGKTYTFDAHASVAAQGTLTVATIPTDGDTMTIGGKVYTFQSVSDGHRREHRDRNADSHAAEHRRSDQRDPPVGNPIRRIDAPASDRLGRHRRHQCGAHRQDAGDRGQQHRDRRDIHGRRKCLRRCDARHHDARCRCLAQYRRPHPGWCKCGGHAGQHRRRGQPDRHARHPIRRRDDPASDRLGRHRGPECGVHRQDHRTRRQRHCDNGDVYRRRKRLRRRNSCRRCQCDRQAALCWKRPARAGGGAVCGSESIIRHATRPIRMPSTSRSGK